LGKFIFGTSLVLLAISLGISFREIQISTVAINLELSDLAASEVDGKKPNEVDGKKPN